MAFSLNDYRLLLEGLLSKGYSFAPIKDYFTSPAGDAAPTIYVRHDVDRLIYRAVAMAEVEHQLNIKTTYYFRCKEGGEFPTAAIKDVQSLKHEVGYHYETMVRSGGDHELSLKLFHEELSELRKLANVETVAAHGSPLSRHSNMGFTRGVSLKDNGLKGEPSLDIDFSSILYVTDTGGQFGSKFNRRDIVKGKNLKGPKSARELLDSLSPEHDPYIVLNCHPERWASSSLGYIQAETTDMMINLAKVVAASIQQPRLPASRI